MEQVMQTDEEFVRGVWELVHQCDGSYMEYPMRTVLVQDVRGHWLDFAAWSAAAAFTRKRLEEVRELREEIECVKEQQGEWAGCTGAPELIYYACWTRTLFRLESILADKTAGMKEGA